jgi:uncharacterized membrane protein
MPQPLAVLLATLSDADLAALSVLALAWAIMCGSRASAAPLGPTVTGLAVRREWMREFVRRDNRIFDAQIIAPAAGTASSPRPRSSRWAACWR